MTIANVENEVGEHKAALSAANEAVEDFRRAFGPHSPQLAQPIEIRGESLEALGRHADAERDLRDASDRWSSWLGPSHEYVAYALTALGKTLLSEQRAVEATAALERALRIREHADPNQDEVAETRFALARARWATDPRHQAVSRKLALLARDTYRKLPNGQKAAAEIDVWLTAHGEVAPGAHQPRIVPR